MPGSPRPRSLLDLVVPLPPLDPIIADDAHALTAALGSFLRYMEMEEQRVAAGLAARPVLPVEPVSGQSLIGRLTDALLIDTPVRRQRSLAALLVALILA